MLRWLAASYGRGSTVGRPGDAKRCRGGLDSVVVHTVSPLPTREHSTVMK